MRRPHPRQWLDLPPCPLLRLHHPRWQLITRVVLQALPPRLKQVVPIFLTLPPALRLHRFLLVAAVQPDTLNLYQLWAAAGEQLVMVVPHLQVEHLPPVE